MISTHALPEPDLVLLERARQVAREKRATELLQSNAAEQRFEDKENKFAFPKPQTETPTKTTKTNTFIEQPGEADRISDPKLKVEALKRLAERRHAQMPDWLPRGPTMWETTHIVYNEKQDILECNGKPIHGSKRLYTSYATGSRTRKQQRIERNQWLGKIVMVLMMKNESKILDRMIESVAPHIDAFLVTDTGSTDNSAEILWNRLTREFKKPGEVYLCPFENFGTTRTVAVQLAHQRGDWLLLFDADYKLSVRGLRSQERWQDKLPSVFCNQTTVGHNPKFAQHLVGQYLLDTDGNLMYARPHLVRGDILWCYHCRTHEFLAQSKKCPSGISHLSATRFSHLLIDHVGDGGSKADKSPRDIMMLEMDLLDNPRSDRAMFYLANSYSAAGCLHEAVDMYKRAMNHLAWYEEVYCASKEAIDTMNRMVSKADQLNQAQFLQEQMEHRLVYLLTGMFRNPHRLEAMHSLMLWVRNCNLLPKYHFLLATLGSFLTFNGRPEDLNQTGELQKLFVDLAVHDHGFWVELCIVTDKSTFFTDLCLFAAQKAYSYSHSEEGKRTHTEEIRRIDAANLRGLLRRCESQVLHEGIRNSIRLRDFLRHAGDVAFASQKYDASLRMYEWVFADLCPKSLFPSEILDAERDWLRDHDSLPDSFEARRKKIDSWSTPMYHEFQLRTAWKACKSVHRMRAGNLAKHQLSDENKLFADVCCQMAKTYHHLDSDNYFTVAACYVNALKFDPTCILALYSLQDMSRDAHSRRSRVVQLLLRLATFESWKELAAPAVERSYQSFSQLQQKQNDSKHERILVEDNPMTNQRMFMPKPCVLARHKARTRLADGSANSFLNDPDFKGTLWVC